MGDKNQELYSFIDGFIKHHDKLSSLSAKRHKYISLAEKIEEEERIVRYSYRPCPPRIIQVGDFRLKLRPCDYQQQYDYCEYKPASGAYDWASIMVVSFGKNLCRGSIQIKLSEKKLSPLLVNIDVTHEDTIMKSLIGKMEETLSIIQKNLWYPAFKTRMGL